MMMICKENDNEKNDRGIISSGSLTIILGTATTTTATTTTAAAKGPGHGEPANTEVMEFFKERGRELEKRHQLL